MSDFKPHLVGVWIANAAIRERPGAEHFHGRIVTRVTKGTLKRCAATDHDALQGTCDLATHLGYYCEVEFNGHRATLNTDHLLDAAEGAALGDAFSPELNVQGDTDGVAVGEGYEVEFSGACPVQGDGMVDGHPCYYRARGKGWSLKIYKPEPYAAPLKAKCIFETGRSCYVWPDAGYLRADLSVKNIERAVAEFRAWKASTPC